MFSFRHSINQNLKIQSSDVYPLPEFVIPEFMDDRVRYSLIHFGSIPGASMIDLAIKDQSVPLHRLDSFDQAAVKRRSRSMASYHKFCGTILFSHIIERNQDREVEIVHPDKHAAIRGDAFRRVE